MPLHTEGLQIVSPQEILNLHCLLLIHPLTLSFAQLKFTIFLHLPFHQTFVTLCCHLTYFVNPSDSCHITHVTVHSWVANPFLHWSASNIPTPPDCSLVVFFPYSKWPYLLQCLFYHIEHDLHFTIIELATSRVNEFSSPTSFSFNALNFPLQQIHLCFKLFVHTTN